MYQDLHLCARQVVDAFSLDLAFLDGLRDALDEGADSLRIRQFADDQRLLVDLFYLGTYLQHATTLSVVVLRDINRTTRLEVGI